MKNKVIRLVACSMLGVLALESTGHALQPVLAALGVNRVLRLKFIEGAADEVGRELATIGSKYEEYALSAMPHHYVDTSSGYLNQTRLPDVDRRMWLDPVTFTQHFQTTRGGVVDRYPFEYTIHNRNFECGNSTTGANSYWFKVTARTKHWIRSQTVRDEPGHEVLNQPVRYEMAQSTLPSSCLDSKPSLQFVQSGTTTVPRGGVTEVAAYHSNVEIGSLVVAYDPNK